MKLRVLLTIFAAAFTTGALTPHEKVVRLLNDKYFRSPTVVLMESTELSLTRTGIVWSRVAQLIPENKDYHILVASFNSTDLARPVEARSAWDVQESARFMTAKIRKFKKSEAPASEVTEDFGAMQALERIATSNWLPYDGCLMLFTALYPSDSDNATRAIQALILRRTKLFVVWLESEKETPEVYRMVAQQTGGELLETNWTPDLNQTAEYEADNTEIFDGRQKEQQKQLITPPVESVQREVLIAVRQGARGKSVMSLPVDSSIDEMEVKITGRLDSAFLRKPSGEPLALVNASDGQRIRTEGEQGRWRLDASGTLYDVAVQATSRLAYDVITPPTPTNTNISQGVSFKLKKLRGEGKLEKVTLVDETGKSLADLENLSGIRRGDSEERRLRFPTPEEEQEAEKEEPGEERNEDAAGDTEWLIPVDKLPSKQYFVQVDGRNAKGEPFRRLSALSVRGGEGWSVPPVMVEVSERSQLSARPGQTVQLYFDVVSFHFRPLPMVFYAHDDRSFIRYINPTRITVYPQTKIQVAVLLEVQAINQDKDTIALTAESIVGPVTGKAYLYANNQRSEDTAKPDISITTDGYCRDYLSPQVCYSKFWRVDANIRDSNGLLRIRSVPLGLEYKNEFIAGTMEEVRVHYQSTCCNTRVDIIAIDIYGNINAKTVDIEKVWLTAGEIAAIVFGSVLALLLLLLIIIAIIFCIRRRRSHNFVMHR